MVALPWKNAFGHHLEKNPSDAHGAVMDFFLNLESLLTVKNKIFVATNTNKPGSYVQNTLQRNVKVNFDRIIAKYPTTAGEAYKQRRNRGACLTKPF